MEQIVEKSQCFGCSTCYHVCPVNAIQMKMNNKGFLYPSIEQSKCIECKMCIKSCSAVESSRAKINGNLLHNAYAIQHQDKNVLKKSSSGGVFIAISDYVLSNGGVVFGAVFDAATQRVIHMKAVNTQQRDRMCGSKYVQSDTSKIFPEVERCLENTIVLFTGTPCQVAGLRMYLKSVPKNLITVDVICHGVPSPTILQEHIKYEERKYHSTLVDYQYRSKKYGYEYTNIAVFSNGKEDSSIDVKRIIKFFTLNMRDSCYTCPYSSRVRYGDLTIGDLWDAYRRVGISDHLGCSIVFANTIKGKEILEKIAPVCRLITMDEKKINRQALSHPVKRTTKVDAFWNTYFEQGYEKALAVFGKVSLKSRIYNSLIRILHKVGFVKTIEIIKSRFGE